MSSRLGGAGSMCWRLRSPDATQGACQAIAGTQQARFASLSLARCQRSVAGNVRVEELRFL
jgi:hypothetical protein